MEKRVYRDRAQLLFHRDAELPLRCLACNRRVKKVVPTRVSWVHPGVWLSLFVLGPGLVAILYYTLRKTAMVELPLCKEHREWRRVRSQLATITFLLG